MANDPPPHCGGNSLYSAVSSNESNQLLYLLRHGSTNNSHAQSNVTKQDQPCGACVHYQALVRAPGNCSACRKNLAYLSEYLYMLEGSNEPLLLCDACLDMNSPIVPTEPKHIERRAVYEYDEPMIQCLCCWRFLHKVCVSRCIWHVCFLLASGFVKASMFHFSHVH